MFNRSSICKLEICVFVWILFPCEVIVEVEDKVFYITPIIYEIPMNCIIASLEIIFINDSFPQFHSIIPCEILLYIEVTFFGIYQLIWGFSGVLGSCITPPKPMGKYEKPQKNDVNSSERSDILVFNCYLCTSNFVYFLFAAPR